MSSFHAAFAVRLRPFYVFNRYTCVLRFQHGQYLSEVFVDFAEVLLQSGRNVRVFYVVDELLLTIFSDP